MFPESDLLPISALQHLLYCERQAALIHVERLWVENRFTAEGGILHRRAHSGKAESRPAGRLTRGLPIRSLALGLFGVADVIRFEAGPDRRIVPVEYKRGRSKKNDCDRVQLCAQALCLEEMFGRSIDSGDLFYGKTRRHVRVDFSAALRQATSDAARRLRTLIDARHTPRAEPGPKCDRCSLRPVCLPRLGGRPTGVLRDFERTLDALLREPGPSG
jgi:CRISPR-associated exonuclease Cas4